MHGHDEPPRSAEISYGTCVSNRMSFLHVQRKIDVYFFFSPFSEISQILARGDDKDIEKASKILRKNLGGFDTGESCFRRVEDARAKRLF